MRDAMAGDVELGGARPSCRSRLVPFDVFMGAVNDPLNTRRERPDLP
jgi:hypothetical protein